MALQVEFLMDSLKTTSDSLSAIGYLGDLPDADEESTLVLDRGLNDEWLPCGLFGAERGLNGVSTFVAHGVLWVILIGGICLQNLDGWESIANLSFRA